MKPKKLYNHWGKHLQRLRTAFNREWPRCKKHGGIESIHRLRVLLRRARLYTRVGRPILGVAIVRQFGKWAESVSDHVGPVRDCDMAVLWLHQAGADAAALKAMRQKRRRLWEKARNQLRTKMLVPLPTDLLDGTGKAAKKLYARFVKTARKAWEEVQACPTPVIRLKNPQWHELRRDVRRLRYLRELALSSKEQRRDELLRRLIRLQDALGAAQNCAVTSTLLRSRAHKSKLAAERRQWLSKADAALVALRASRAWRRQPDSF